MSDLSGRRYGGMFGPTVGDRMRLADTSLVVEVERDLTLAGEEATFGGGKSAREGRAQGTATREEGAMDLVITNALVMDHWGIVKADVGVLGGRIAAIGWVREAVEHRPWVPATSHARADHHDHPHTH